MSDDKCSPIHDFALGLAREVIRLDRERASCLARIETAKEELERIKARETALHALAELYPATDGHGISLVGYVDALEYAAEVKVNIETVIADSVLGGMPETRADESDPENPDNDVGSGVDDLVSANPAEVKAKPAAADLQADPVASAQEEAAPAVDSLLAGFGSAVSAVLAEKRQEQVAPVVAHPAKTPDMRSAERLSEALGLPPALVAPAPVRVDYSSDEEAVSAFVKRKGAKSLAQAVTRCPTAYAGLSTGQNTKADREALAKHTQDQTEQAAAGSWRTGKRAGKQVS